MAEAVELVAWGRRSGSFTGLWLWVMRIGDIPDSVYRRLVEGETVPQVWPELVGLPFQVIAGEDTDAPDTVPAIYMPDR